MSERGFNRFFEFVAMLAQSVAQFRHMLVTVLALSTCILRLNLLQITDHAIPYSHRFTKSNFKSKFRYFGPER